MSLVPIEQDYKVYLETLSKEIDLIEGIICSIENQDEIVSEGAILLNSVLEDKISVLNLIQTEKYPSDWAKTKLSTLPQEINILKNITTS